MKIKKLENTNCFLIKLTKNELEIEFYPLFQKRKEDLVVNLIELIFLNVLFINLKHDANGNVFLKTLTVRV